MIVKLSHRIWEDCRCGQHAKAFEEQYPSVDFAVHVNAEDYTTPHIILKMKHEDPVVYKAIEDIGLAYVREEDYC